MIPTITCGFQNAFPVYLQCAIARLINVTIPSFFGYREQIEAVSVVVNAPEKRAVQNLKTFLRRTSVY
jgi:hypothetical protein